MRCCPLKRVFNDDPEQPRLAGYDLVLERVEVPSNQFQRREVFGESTLEFDLKTVGQLYLKPGATPCNPQEWLTALDQHMLLWATEEPFVDIEIV